MLARLSAFVIWALVAATAVFWGLRLFVRAPAAPAYAVPVGDTTLARGDLSRLLGSAPASAAAAAPIADANSRFKLLGIMAPRGPADAGVAAHGVALIAVDGKIPRAYTVGSKLDGDLVLQSVSLRTAAIGSGQGAPSITLELPPIAAPATGKLPAGPTSGPYVPPTPGVPPPTQFPPQPVPQTLPVGQAPQQLVPGVPARPEGVTPTQ